MTIRRAASVCAPDFSSDEAVDRDEPLVINGQSAIISNEMMADSFAFPTRPSIRSSVSSDEPFPQGAFIVAQRPPLIRSSVSSD
jgi:hypothetical protein